MDDHLACLSVAFSDEPDRAANQCFKARDTNLSVGVSVRGGIVPHIAIHVPTLWLMHIRVTTPIDR